MAEIKILPQPPGIAYYGGSTPLRAISRKIDTQRCGNETTLATTKEDVFGMIEERLCTADIDYWLFRSTTWTVTSALSNILHTSIFHVATRRRVGYTILASRLAYGA